MMQPQAEETFTLSAHAATRMAQRGIRESTLNLVLLHGAQSKAGSDCEEYLLPKRTARELSAAGYDGNLIKAATKVRAIVGSDGTVVTCYQTSQSLRSRCAGNC